MKNERICAGSLILIHPETSEIVIQKTNPQKWVQVGTVISCKDEGKKGLTISFKINSKYTIELNKGE